MKLNTKKTKGVCKCWCHKPQYPEDIRDNIPCISCKENHCQPTEKPMDKLTEAIKRDCTCPKDCIVHEKPCKCDIRDFKGGGQIVYADKDCPIHNPTEKPVDNYMTTKNEKLTTEKPMEETWDVKLINKIGIGHADYCQGETGYEDDCNCYIVKIKDLLKEERERSNLDGYVEGVNNQRELTSLPHEDNLAEYKQKLIKRIEGMKAPKNMLKDERLLAGNMALDEVEAVIKDE